MKSRRFPRRTLLRRAGAAALAGGAGFGPVLAAAAAGSRGRARGYGPLVADPGRRLHLPPGFSYRVISRAGARMGDGFVVPALADGMHAFAGANGRTVLLRNHEIDPGAHGSAFGHLPAGPDARTRSRMYDAAAGGGVTRLVYDTRAGRVERENLALAGTLRNCAGGATPWGSWISCEEIVLSRGEGGHLEDHGFNFEVPAASPGLVRAVPLEAMGRFNHEAVGVDVSSGVVYQSEDRPDGLFYRFIPSTPGELQKGGRLEALALPGLPRVFTGNWFAGGRIPKQVLLGVAWVPLRSVTASGDRLRHQGRDRGAAAFARGEGVTVEMRPGEAAARIWLMCTAGGRNKRGQLWCYRPSPFEGTAREREQPGTLELFVEPNDSRLLNHGDNVCVAPTGDLVISEDNSDMPRLIGITPAGATYVLAANARADSEFAGATFSPDGSTLFVNLQAPGLTFAITGPWSARDAGSA